jgi:hypothetical protein
VQQKLFLYDEVLHMNVDNLVESGGRAGVNSAKFNTMIRIAQFWCNAPESRQARWKFFKQSDESHRVVGRKAQIISAEEVWNGKRLHENAREERKLVEHSRETILFDGELCGL